MARRRARKLLISGAVTATDLSRSVIEKYVTTASTKVGDWAGNYTNNIKVYIADKARQSLAQTKLATWYDIYLTVVYPKVKEAFATGRTDYIKRVIKPLGGGVAAPAF
jgi:hypothetical protein